MGRVAPEDQVMDGQHGRHAAQRHQQVLGGVEERGAGQQLVERNAHQLAQPYQHPPWLVTQGHRPAGHVLQPGQRLHALLRIVEERQPVAEERQERAAEALGIAPQPRATMDRRGDVEIDGHGVKINMLREKRQARLEGNRREVVRRAT